MPVTSTETLPSYVPSGPIRNSASGPSSSTAMWLPSGSGADSTDARPDSRSMPTGIRGPVAPAKSMSNDSSVGARYAPTSNSEPATPSA